MVRLTKEQFDLIIASLNYQIGEYRVAIREHARFKYGKDIKEYYQRCIDLYEDCKRAVIELELEQKAKE